jgi:hypothetical protein
MDIVEETVALGEHLRALNPEASDRSVEEVFGRKIENGHTWEAILLSVVPFRSRVHND